jgi:hypothetical protein
LRKLVQVIVILLTILSLYNLKNIQIDASPDTLLLKNNKDYIYSQEIDKRYKTKPIVFLSIKSNQSFINKEVINKVDKLTKELKNVKEIANVISLSNIPLLESSNIDISNMNNVSNIQSEDINLKKVKEELKKNKIYIDNIINKDFTAINFIIEIVEKEEQTIKTIRNIIKKEKQQWKQIEFGGLQVIKQDIIKYVENDLVYLGLLSLIIFLIFIGFIFKNKEYIKYILINLITIVLFTTTIIILFGFKITVISSNFSAILMVLSLSLSIHLIIRLNENNKEKNKIEITIKEMWKPTLMVVLTTMLGFISLLLSNIKPVIDFSWMMIIGLFVSIVMSFINFKYVINEKKVKKVSFNNTIPLSLYNFYTKKSTYLHTIVSVVVLLSIYGASKITVENSFVDYFKKDSEIYKSLVFLDKNFGGTTPLDIIVKIKKEKKGELFDKKIDNSFNIEQGLEKEDNFEEESFDDFESGEEFEIVEKEKYFNTSMKEIQIIEGIHKKLQNNKDIGKVQSMGMIYNMLKYYKKSEMIVPSELEFIYGKIPNSIKDSLVLPYFNKEKGEYRFSIRIFDSNEGLQRDKLIKQIEKDIKEKYSSELEYVKITGTMLLYNNLLQSLKEAQVNSFLFVIIAMFILFMIMIKNIKQSLILIVVNVISVISILGILGIFGIPLDLMSITIISIALGISVDDSIHFVDRYNLIKIDKGLNTQKTVGVAMLLTTIAVIIGFSVMVFSNFIPSIYFGVLISIVMVIALLINQTLLPYLLNKTEKN